jgi:large subunit ribosomal protein L17
MRHHKKHRIFGREKGVREALIKSLARSLIIEGAIETSVAKAKEIRPFVERLVTLAKNDTLASKRLIASRMNNSLEVVAKLGTDYAPRYKERAGGYTRITKLGYVKNAAFETARIEFV